MNTDSNEILSSMLEAYQNNPDKRVEDIITEFSKKMDISPDTTNSIKETLELLDSVQKKNDKLQEYKKDGISTKAWLATEIDTIIDDKSDDDKVAIKNAITTTILKNID